VVRVTPQGRRHVTILYSVYDFLFIFRRNFVSILYRFRIIVNYLSKVTNYSYPTWV